MAADADSRGEDPRTDEVLMAAYRAGEARAFAVLVTRHKRGLYNFLLRSVHQPSRAEELLQDVFVRVIRSKDRWEQTAKFSTWVYTIARNLTIDESRRQRFRDHQSLDAKRTRGADGEQGRSMLDTLPSGDLPTDVEADRPTLQGRLQAAVEALPEDQREVFTLRQVVGLSFKEIGDIVGAPENTVKSRMRYALEKLRTLLVDLDPRDEAQERSATGGAKAGAHG